MKYFNLFRIPNLLLLAAMQLSARYGFYFQEDIPGALYHYQFALLILATICLAAAGYVINDLHDQTTDQINKPNKNIIGKSISENVAWKIYISLNIIGVSCGFFLSHVINKPWFILIFMAVVWLLYQYAVSLKKIALVGNLTIAFLAFLSVMLVPLFDLYPLVNEGNKGYLGVFFSILLDFGIFAFFLHFIREVVKDLEDVNGDYNQGMHTLPIVFGVKRTARALFIFAFLPIALQLFYLYEYFFKTSLFLVLAFSIIFITGPFIFCTIKLFDAKTTKSFREVAFILKLIMAALILLLPLLSYTIRVHA